MFGAPWEHFVNFEETTYMQGAGELVNASSLMKWKMLSSILHHYKRRCNTIFLLICIIIHQLWLFKTHFSQVNIKELKTWSAPAKIKNTSGPSPMLLVSSNILNFLCIYHVIVLVIVFRLSLPTDYTTIHNGHAEFMQFYTFSCLFFTFVCLWQTVQSYLCWIRHNF